MDWSFIYLFIYLKFNFFFFFSSSFLFSLLRSIDLYSIFQFSSDYAFIPPFDSYLVLLETTKQIKYHPAIWGQLWESRCHVSARVMVDTWAARYYFLFFFLSIYFYFFVFFFFFFSSRLFLRRCKDTWNHLARFGQRGARPRWDES